MPAESLWQKYRSLQSALPPWVGQALRFGLVGVGNTLVDAACYWALTRWLGAPPLPSKALSYTAGVLNSFYWNRRWTFRSSAGVGRSLPLFVAVSLVGLALNSGIMALILHLGLPDGLGWIAATGGTLAWNFVASKFLVFRK